MRSNSQSTKDAIKDAARIESVAQLLGISLIRHGDELKGDCPSGHGSDGHQCFTIPSDKQFYYCFSCDATGDVISLVQLVQQSDFKSALTWLATNFAPEYIPALDRQTFQLNPEEKKELMNAMLYEELFKHGRQLLYQQTGTNALAALTGRGYDVQNLKNTEWIYWPKERDIRNYLLQVRPNHKTEIQDIPLIGAFGDNFRLAFPYRDRRGMITGFVKRSEARHGMNINGMPSVRWDSTPGVKKTDLYGLHRISKTDRVVILEGYPDALYLPTLGMNEVLAIGQAILSEKHIPGLRAKKIRRVVISFDNDQPKNGVVKSIENTEKAVRLLFAEGFEVFVVDPPSLSPHKDPDELVTASGIAVFQTIVDNAASGARWLANRIINKHNITTDQGKQDALDEALEVEESLANPLDSKTFIDVLSAGIGIPVEMLQPHIQQYHEKKAKENLEKELSSVVKRINGKIDAGEIEEALEFLGEQQKEIQLNYERAKVEPPIPLDVHLREKRLRDLARMPGQLLGHRLDWYPTVQNKLCGVQSGLYILGAYPNVGKTALFVNLMLDLLHANPQAHVLFFSMDDNRDTIINRCLARATQLEINAVQTRQSIPSLQQLIDDGYTWLTDMVTAGRLGIFDAGEVLGMDKIELEVLRHPRKDNLIVFIDGLYNVNVEGKADSIREENINRANAAKRLSKQFSIPVLTTAELRKKQTNEKKDNPPSMHDIMESGKYGYNADVILLLYPADMDRYTLDSEPIMILKFEKNKLSDFRDVIEFVFVRAKSTYRESQTATTQWQLPGKAA